jgi:hypothetical protein
MAWTTNDEQQFLRGMGTWSVSSKHRRGNMKTRAEQLRGYLRAANNRDDWGEMRKNEVLLTANTLLKIEEGVINPCSQWPLKR